MWEVISSRGKLPVAERGGSGQAGKRWRWPGPPGLPSCAQGCPEEASQREPRPQGSGPPTPPLRALVSLQHTGWCVCFTLKAAVFQADTRSVLSHFEPTTTLKQFKSQMGASLTALTLGFLICTNRPRLTSRETGSSVSPWMEEAHSAGLQLAGLSAQKAAWG